MAIKRIFSFFFLLIISCGSYLEAQTPLQPDSISREYFSAYDTSFVPRLYLSQKYLSTVISNGDMPKLRYRPNSNLSMGIGASYGWFSLNVAVGLKFLKPKDDERGESKAFDLQGHFYGPRAVFDLFLSHYDGYYLAPEGRGSATGKYYVRPDIRNWQMGFAGFYTLNWRKYSFSAAFLQTSWQRKSAGSFLVGMGINNSDIIGDSALVPAIYAHDDYSRRVRQSWCIALGPQAGYAYTLVLGKHKHWYLAGAVLGGASVDWVRESLIASPTMRSTSVRPTASYKAALGYNTERFSVSATWAHHNVYSKGVLGNYTVSAGNTRLHFAYRFMARKKFKEYWNFFQYPLY